MKERLFTQSIEDRLPRPRRADSLAHTDPAGRPKNAKRPRPRLHPPKTPKGNRQTAHTGPLGNASPAASAPTPNALSP